MNHFKDKRVDFFQVNCDNEIRLCRNQYVVSYPVVKILGFKGKVIFV